MPQGAKTEKLRNSARFREYAAANVADWYKFVNGPRGCEAKNGDVRLVVGFDKSSSWGIATFTNLARHNTCRLRFGPSPGDPTGTYRWSEYSGTADVRAGPDPDENDELKRAGDPSDVQFENQCLFVRTLNVTLEDNVWVNIHSGLGSVHIRNTEYPHVKGYVDPNRPHASSPGTPGPGTGGGSSSPSQGVQDGTQGIAGPVYGLQDALDDNPGMFISVPPQSIVGLIPYKH